MFLLDVLSYFGIGFLVTFVIVKYNIVWKRSPIDRTDIKLTFVFWPLIIIAAITWCVCYCVTLPIRRVFNLLIDIIESTRK